MIDRVLLKKIERLSGFELREDEIPVVQAEIARSVQESEEWEQMLLTDLLPMVQVSDLPNRLREDTPSQDPSACIISSHVPQKKEGQFVIPQPQKK